MSELSKKLEIPLSSVQKAISRKVLCAGFYISTEKMEKFPIREYKRNRNGKIFQYDLEGNFLKEFSNLKEARLALGKKMTRLSECVIEKRPCEGFL